MKTAKSVILSLMLLFSAAIAHGHTELNYPEGGETFYSCYTVLIKLTEVAQHQTQNWELYFSPDAGDSWEEISTNIAVPLREFKWVVPFTSTSQGRIKVVQNNSGTDYEDMSANFNVEMAQGTDELPVVAGSFFNFPNPAGSFTVITYTLAESAVMQLYITDLKGSVVRRVAGSEQGAGTHKFNVDISDLPRGTYLYTLQMGDAVRTRKLLVSR